MTNKRIIARLDVKAPNLIKGINLEGLRKIGDPSKHALTYYNAGLDEILYMDIVASLYDRSGIFDIVKYTSENIFVPITAGGGLRNLSDVEQMMRSGADKVAINTAAIRNPSLISEISRKYGSQCMVLSVEAKKVGPEKWEAYTDNGREKTGLDVLEWVAQAITLGAGEILLTSVDKEGTRKGMDIALLKYVSEAVSVPVIASGGAGSPDDIVASFHEGKVDAVAIADMLHYDRHNYGDIRKTVMDSGIDLRAL